MGKRERERELPPSFLSFFFVRFLSFLLSPRWVAPECEKESMIISCERLLSWQTDREGRDFPALSFDFCGGERRHGSEFGKGKEE